MQPGIKYDAKSCVEFVNRPAAPSMRNGKKMKEDKNDD